MITLFEWLTLSMIVLVLLVLFAVILLIKIAARKKEGVPFQPNYRVLFFTGITFMGAGVALSISTENPGLYGLGALGVIYMIIGITNREKWNNGNK